MPIKGIVESGSQEMLSAFAQENDISFIVFATPTTIEEGIYGNALREHGIPSSQIIEQACPGLPDAISNDDSGKLAHKLMSDFVPMALKQFSSVPQNLVAFLGCTHYGYQADMFERSLQALVPKARVLNPNQGSVDSILSRFDNEPGDGRLTIEFITRYVIPEVVINSLSVYIGEKAPGTLSALKSFTHLPELCGDLPR